MTRLSSKAKTTTTTNINIINKNIKPNLIDISNEFEKLIVVKRRKYRWKEYPETFIGYDAVTILYKILITINTKFTRNHAVMVGNLIMTKIRMFEHVTKDHELEDDYLLYRFISITHRIKLPQSEQEDENIVMTYLNNNNNNDNNNNNNEQQQQQQQQTKFGHKPFCPFMAIGFLKEPTQQKHHHQQQHIELDEFSSMSESSTDRDDVSTTFYKSAKRSMVADVNVNAINLAAAAAAFEIGVEVKTHRHHGKKFKKSFVGADAIDYLIATRLATNRKQAEELGKLLQQQFNLFEHVTNEHEFCDDYLFYKFTEPSKRLSKQLSIGEQAEKEKANLNDIAKSFKRFVLVKNHRYRLKTYKKCFIGSDAVSYLVKAKYAKSRTDAVQLGQQLVNKCNLFEHVCKEHDFIDDYFFYRFIEEEEEEHDDDNDNEKNVSTTTNTNTTTTTTTTASPPPPVAKTTTITAEGSTSVTTSSSLSSVANDFKSGVHVTTHYHRFKKYKRTFVGSEAVDFLVNSSLALSRREAVKLGRQLAKELNLFHHVTREHDFKDDYLFYRFVDDETDDIDSSQHSTFSMKQQDLPKLAKQMKAGIHVKDRRWYHKVYKDTFLGTEAITFLVAIGAAHNRFDAVTLGNQLQTECKLFEHVERDHILMDKHLFYRFLKTPIIDDDDDNDDNNDNDSTTNNKRNNFKLKSIAKKFEQGVTIGINRWRFRTYKNTFIGSDAITFLVDSKYAKTRDEAIEIGRQLATTFNLFEHVARDHELCDEHYFYRFIKVEDRWSWDDGKRDMFIDEKIWFQETELKEESDEGIWKRRIVAFETKVSQARRTPGGIISLRRQPSLDIIVPSPKTSTKKEICRGRLKLWASNFRRLDPRYRILEFFNEVSQLGAADVEAAGINLENVRPLLWFIPRASVFSVWRPTSLVAIRKMMLGQAVGKGLDIKGKSAKRGKLSGYIPFLQIGENRHKAHVRTLPKDGSVRLFFPSTSFKARDSAVAELESVAEEMMSIVAEAKKVLASDDATDIQHEEAKESLLCQIDNPTIEYIDDYAPVSYGLEIPLRLFWEAFVMRQDCTRKLGSQYDTGRPSTPAFQDMNFAALGSRGCNPGSRVVIWQMANPDNPLNPMELLMAYEEYGRVLPVVSDFDPFLVGTRHVPFDPMKAPLAPEQVDVLKWQVSQIDSVLESPRPENWMNRWFEVIDKAKGFKPNTPCFGFGDPKSYSIIQNVVDRLTRDGAVRHGAECFNYFFPQELDEEFLVISDALSGNVPWKHMDEEELREFLLSCVDKGYTFPLNPKWILCDPGWKLIYDKLVSSDNKEVQNSMEVWFPIHSGIREQIEDIHLRYPNGFQRVSKRSQMKKVSGGVRLL